MVLEQKNCLTSFSPIYCFIVFYWKIIALQCCGGLCRTSKRISHNSVQFSCSVVSDSLRPHEPQHARPPCPSPSLGVHSDSRHIQLFATPWTEGRQAPLSMGFSRQEYWRGLPSSRGSSPKGIKPMSLVLQADFLPSEPPGKP